MRKFTRIASLMLVAALLAVPSLAFADLQYLELTDTDKSYSEKALVEVPNGGFPDNPVEDGINPITGEGWVGTYQPIMSTIDTHPDALPHWGVSSADLMYEDVYKRQA